MSSLRRLLSVSRLEVQSGRWIPRALIVLGSSIAGGSALSLLYFAVYCIQHGYNMLAWQGTMTVAIAGGAIGLFTFHYMAPALLDSRLSRTLPIIYFGTVLSMTVGFMDLSAGFFAAVIAHPILTLACLVRVRKENELCALECVCGYPRAPLWLSYCPECGRRFWRASQNNA